MATRSCGERNGVCYLRARRRAWAKSKTDKPTIGIGIGDDVPPARETLQV